MLHSKFTFGVHYTIPFLRKNIQTCGPSCVQYNIFIGKKQHLFGRKIASNITVSCNTRACTRTIDTTENIVVIIGDEKASQLKLKLNSCL